MGPSVKQRLSALAASIALGGAAVGFAAVPAAYAAFDDNATVCKASGQTMTDGIKTFTSNMEKVGTLAAKGDLQAADTAVSEAGATLVTLAGKLRQDAAKADDAALKGAVNDVATQLEDQGKKLDGLTSLQTFDGGKVQTAVDKVTKICGTTVGPSVGPLPTS